MKIHLHPRASGPLALLLFITLTACIRADRNTLAPEVLRSVEVEPRSFDELRPGDALDVRFRRTPELDSSLVVRPDGSISVPLAGKLEAAGQTPDELADAIEWRCATEIREPDVTVIVTGFEGRAVHVGGEVEEPGRFVLGAPTSLLEALILAGGPRESAEMKSVLVLRAVEGEARTVFEIDLQAAIDGRAPLNNVRLLPSDIVYVPRSGVASLNLWVDQYVRENLPFNVAIRPDFGVQ